MAIDRLRNCFILFSKFSICGKTAAKLRQNFGKRVELLCQKVYNYETDSFLAGILEEI